MFKIRTFSALLCAALSASLPVASFAVDYGPQITRIWGGDGRSNVGRGVARIDFIDTINQQEMLAVSDLITTTSPNAEGMIKARYKIKLAIRKANGPLVVNLPTMQATSQPFPDPCDPDNQERGATKTWYTEDWVSVFAFGGPSCAEGIAEFFVDQGHFNAAVGSSNQERTLMFGLSIVGSYYNSNKDGDVSVYKFYSFDADDHRLLCNFGFKGEDQNEWELTPELSGVGPYLGGGDDVLRVVFEKDTATEGQSKFKYQHYDVRTCELTKQKVVTSPAI